MVYWQNVYCARDEAYMRLSWRASNSAEATNKSVLSPNSFCVLYVGMCESHYCAKCSCCCVWVNRFIQGVEHQMGEWECEEYIYWFASVTNWDDESCRCTNVWTRPSQDLKCFITRFLIFENSCVVLISRQ